MIEWINSHGLACLAFLIGFSWVMLITLYFFIRAFLRSLGRVFLGLGS